jgi:hypothetical protein
VPFQFTTAPLTKLLPFTVNVNAGPPTKALAGESEETMGAVLLIAKVTAADVPPPGVGLLTVMLADPALAMSLAGTGAVSWLALTKVVVSAVPFHFTTELATKLAPLTVSVKAAPPTVAPVGATDAMLGAGLLMGNVVAADVPPPGAGLVMVILADPEFAISLAGIWAETCVALTYTVVNATPFKLTTEPATKLVPFTVSVKAAPPALALVGESEAIVGAGFVTAKLAAPEVPPPGLGLVTVMLAVPVLTRSLAGTCAMILLAPE